MNIDIWNHKTGKKKTAISKIYISEGTGNIYINNINIKNIKNKNKLILNAYIPMSIINFYKINIKIFQKGGGEKSKITSTIYGIKKILLKHIKKSNKIFKKYINLKQDTRIVEPKKTGKKKSRKNKQFSKR